MRWLWVAVIIVTIGAVIAKRRWDSRDDDQGGYA